MEMIKIPCLDQLLYGKRTELVSSKMVHEPCIMRAEAEVHAGFQAVKPEEIETLIVPAVAQLVLRFIDGGSRSQTCPRRLRVAVFLPEVWIESELAREVGLNALCQSLAFL